MLTDVAGIESADFFCGDGSPCTGYCDAGSTRPEYCGESKGSRWAAWRCDDQFVFYKIRDAMLQAGVVRELRSGPRKVTPINSTGYITWRALSASEFAMARTYARGHRTGSEIALHMATFNGDKVNALREAQLWLVDPPSFFAGSFIELSEGRMRAAQSLDEERLLLLLLLRTASVLNRTVVLPSFRCDRSPVVARGGWGWPLRTLWDMLYAAFDEWGIEGSFWNSSRWQTVLGMDSCPYYFHFDYRALERAGISFRPRSFFKDAHAARADNEPTSGSDAETGEESVRRRRQWDGIRVDTQHMKSFQEFKRFFELSGLSPPTQPHVPSAAPAAQLSASRLILDWDILNDSAQLTSMVGQFSAAEVQSLLAATEMSFGV